jgi:putative ABC transport system permease protein
LIFNEARPARARQELNQLPGVLYAEPFRSVAAKLQFQHRSHKVAIMGLESTQGLRHLLNRQLRTVTLPPDGLVLTNKLAQMLQIQPGENLTVEVLEGDRPLRTIPLVGEIEELLGVSAYMDIHALNRMMREGGVISGAFLAVDHRQLASLYADLKQLPMIANVSLRQAMIERFQATVGESRAVVTALQVGFACVIAFGVVYNAARIALSERSRELATLRIIGFSRLQVAIVLLGEQAVLTLVAIPVGFLLGYGLAGILSRAYDTELYRLPLIITRSNYAFAFIVISSAALISGLIVRRQLDRLDLIAVLKTRE